MQRKMCCEKIDFFSDIVYLLLLDPLACKPGDQENKRVNRIIVLLAAEPEKLCQKLLAAGARKFHNPILDVPRRYAQPCALILDGMHCLHAECPALHLLDRGLLVRDCFNEKLAAHVRATPYVIERLHRLAERHAANDGVRLDVDFELTVWPRNLAAHYCRVVRAFLCADCKVYAVRQVIAIIERRVIVIGDVLGQYVLPLLRHDLQEHLAPEADVAQLVALGVYRLLRRILRFPCAPLYLSAVALPQQRKLKHGEDARVLQPRHQAIGMQPVADDDAAAVVLVNRGQHVSAHPSVALVAVLLGAYPVEVFHVVGNDERWSVLPVLDAAYLLATGARENAHAVVEDAVHRLPVFVALKRRLWPWVVDLLVFEVPVVAEDQLIVAQLVLNACCIDARLPARVGEHDDKRVLVWVFERSPEHKRERCQRALRAPAETDDLQALDVAVLQRGAHLIEEVGKFEREVMREVSETEALEGLGRCTADFRVVYETLKLKRLFFHSGRACALRRSRLRAAESRCRR